MAPSSATSTSCRGTNPFPRACMSSKRDRHEAIQQLVHEHRIFSQEELRELLVGRGFDVTQATVSRDIRELRLIKMPDAEGGTHYVLPPDSWEKSPALLRLLPILFVGVEG